MDIRIFLVDDHEIVRRGLVDLLGGVPGFAVVGEASTVAEALTAIPALEQLPRGSARGPVDVAVLDVRLPDGSGVELCRDLRSACPGLRALMLTSYSDDEALVDAVMAGASGYLLKQILGTDLVAAIRTAAGGGSLMDGEATAAALDRIRTQRSPGGRVEDLTDQERTVLDLIGEGLTNREIGQRMYLAEKTVKNYVSRLFTKLGMQRRTQVAVLATELRAVRGEG
ncbi:response regulator [Rhodococcus sp. NPDC127528]|uniref:response regulator n=1 Tax=unclassified Rhodococcus (in: high G+C Gram-positive bacteria) TaxID=192944 RepID=UPI0036412B8A